jgi:hypothetical protein
MLEITTTDFSHNYHNSQVIEPKNGSAYTLHAIDVFNMILINGMEYGAVYQTAQHFIHNDYDHPSPELGLVDFYHDIGTSRLVSRIAVEDRAYIEALGGADLLDFCETLTDTKDYKRFSVDELLKIHDTVTKNRINARLYLENLDLAQLTN